MFYVAVCSMDSYNGHLVAKNIPGPLITFVKKPFISSRFESSMDTSRVKCVIDFPGGPDNKAYICVGTNCCKYLNKDGVADSKTDWEKSQYDIIMIDDEYTVYFPEKNPRTGTVLVFPTNAVLSKEEVVEALMIAAERYRRNPIKPKGSFLRRPTDADRRRTCPIDMINPYDALDLPGSWE